MLTKDLKFEHQLEVLLPESYALLKSANLQIHESVSDIILHGSRGLTNRPRPASDIDLSLIVDSVTLSRQPEKEPFLHDILYTTLSQWQCDIELDLAAVFDSQHCKLKCFDLAAWDAQICNRGGMDCFGLYKIQKGFNGLVIDAGVQVRLMYPCLKIWHRA
jgi:hypothetical protein